MKISRVEIFNSRSIEHISFKIDNLAILVGENNSGKSNILRAMELFYQDSVRGIDEECFCNKKMGKPISIIITFDRLTKYDRIQKYLKSWIFNNEIRVKKIIKHDQEKQRCEMTYYGWQAKPKEDIFNLDKFDEYKNDIKKIVEDHNLPDYFRNEKGNVTMTSYKEGIKEHTKLGHVELGEPDWIKNPGGYKEVFSDLLPKFYLVPAVKDAQDESKTTQQTVLGKLIIDLTNRITKNNPKFEAIKKQIDGLKKYLNRDEKGDDTNRLKEIKDFEQLISNTISENMPNTKVGIEIITPELVDLFKEVRITLDDALPTSIDAKGHGLQRALIFAYIRAYAKAICKDKDKEDNQINNFILAIEEPELYLHPNGQRKMMAVLKNISRTDQIIACTHSNYFVDMFEYKNILIVSKNRYQTTNVYQYIGDIFETDNSKDQKRLTKTFRYLSMFDLSRSELFFSKKVILVEGDTEKFILPFWASKYAEKDIDYNFAANNICVIECGGKSNIHIFARVLNRFKIPYIVIHDIDPISFPIDKLNKSDKEKGDLRMFNENEVIENAVDKKYGHIIKINPELENVIMVSKGEVKNHGKIGAAYFKYEDLGLEDYPEEIKLMLDKIKEWKTENKTYEISYNDKT